VNGRLADEAVAFGAVVDRAVVDAGGVDLARAAEADPGTRADVAALLADLGAWELDPRSGGDELEAAALACRAAGRWALPYPVAQRLAAGPGEEAVAVVGEGAPVVDHADLPLAWRVCDGTGRSAPVLGVAGPPGRRLGPFVRAVDLGPWQVGDDAAPLALTLQAWTLLGAAEAAAERTVAHVRQREQFGRPLAEFQAVQFTLTETAVATAGLEALGRYTLWSVGRGGRHARADAVALRLAALETSETVFRIAHQLHGATGFADETELSWLSRHGQPARRLPWGRSRTEAQLLTLLEEAPLEGPFSPGPDDTEVA
jgi:hypothetical protein